MASISTDKIGIKVDVASQVAIKKIAALTKHAKTFYNWSKRKQQDALRAAAKGAPSIEVKAVIELQRLEKGAAARRETAKKKEARTAEIESNKRRAAIEKQAAAFWKAHIKRMAALRKENRVGRGRGGGGGGGGVGGGFAGRAMVAGGALTALTQNMAFLGPGFAAMSGGGPGAALVAASTAVGLFIQSGKALEERLITLSERAEDFGGSLGGILALIRDQEKFGQLGRDVFAAERSGMNVGTAAKTGWGGFMDEIAGKAMNLPAKFMDMVTMGGATRAGEDLMARGETADILANQNKFLREAELALEKKIDPGQAKLKRAQQEHGNLARAWGLGKMDLGLFNAQTARVKAYEEGVKAEIESTRLEKEKIALTKADNKAQRMKEQRESRIKADTDRRDRERKVLTGKARRIRGITDPESILPDSAADMAALIAAGVLDKGTATKALGKGALEARTKGKKEFKSAFVGIEALSKRIQTAAASKMHPDEPTKADMKKASELIKTATEAAATKQTDALKELITLGALI